MIGMYLQLWRLYKKLFCEINVSKNKKKEKKQGRKGDKDRNHRNIETEQLQN